jgi:D-methionine transport system ATP-binding protein
MIKSKKIADLVGLSDKHNAYPSQLSGGQRQRVAIARALVADVNLLLCDEFTSALDPETSLDILSLLRQINKQLGVTIILITHDMSVVREICDRVCVIEQGSIVEEGSIESILLSPKHTITESLVSHLFIKDLPHSITECIHQKHNQNDHVVLRLAFSAHSAKQPIIASIITNFNIPVNIIAGSLDHVRELALGSLIVTIPVSETLLAKILQYFHTCEVTTKILGFIALP